jgi:hypothetical protein
MFRTNIFLYAQNQLKITNISSARNNVYLNIKPPGIYDSLFNCPLKNNTQRKVTVKSLALRLLIRVTPRSKAQTGTDYSG